MKNRDLKRSEIKNKLNEAVKNNDAEAFMNAYNELTEAIEEEVKENALAVINEKIESIDASIMSARGQRQITNEEKIYYNKVIEAMKSENPQMAIKQVETTMPLTIIESVFEDLKIEFPLLTKINFTNTTGLTKFIIQSRETAGAKWGALNSKIVEEIVAGFKAIDLKLLKLTAFLPISKDMLDLGATWLDSYVRQVLVTVLMAGLEDGIINGDGKDKPIGMIRQVGEGVSVLDGVYPEKDKEKVTAFNQKEVGALTAKLSVGADGKARAVKDLILVVNPEDYYSKVMPATKMLTSTGVYADVFPTNTAIVQSSAVAKGTAVYGIASNYFMGLGTSKNGKIEYSDDAKFLEDERVYIVKLYGNGQAKDNTSFLNLDISKVKEFAYPVQILKEAE